MLMAFQATVLKIDVFVQSGGPSHGVVQCHITNVIASNVSADIDIMISMIC